MANGFSLATTMDPEADRIGIKVVTGLFGLLMITGVIIGIYGFFVGHEHVFNTTREVPWGLIIAAYAFFAITSTGLCLLAAISHAFGGNKIAPLANRMVWLSLIILISGFMSIGMELENPWRMAIWNVISPNITSNIWWMGTLYGLAVGFMVLEFWLILNRHYKLSLALGVLGALAEIAANSCLGGVFATLPARPYWYGGQLPMYFLACAFTSGAAATVLFTHLACIIRGKKMDQDIFIAVQSAAKVLVLMLIMVSVATFWKMISFFVGGHVAGLEAAKTLLSGPLSNNFWYFEVGIGLALPLALLVVTRLKSLVAMSAASLMTLIGMFVSRMDMVIAGQLVPHYAGFEDIPKLYSYVPSSFEWMVVLGSIGFCGTAFLLGERFFGKKFAEHATH